ncbi:hypothetical protein E3174_10350 [Escherichia coli O157:H7]|nr:hypothetical protein CR916_20195 [Escherichia coli]NOV10816.1 hypothetical protein [Escherichia coli O157:H7]QKB28959.1 hypothetical protein E3157_16615 [Escherichia coli O55:H7]QKB33999.1 hypothetical protein E3156_17810 [Escherichia coli O55:H7]TKT64149.1 hypothetical protein DXX75_020710 [Escherichia coli]
MKMIFLKVTVKAVTKPDNKADHSHLPVLSDIAHFRDPPRIANHTICYQLHPCNKSTTLDKITKFYLIPH